ncbi:MAG: lycopene cyclase family protein [Anaerolineae bacterium]|nr:lycopene cyclase family protein [Anaerolineae bacterium]
MPKIYDLIFAGAGCAGLSLLWHLGHANWRDWPKQQVLLIDPAPKTQNDRTWCFWETGPGPFEEIVHRRWQQLDFWGASDIRPQPLDIAPYAYKMIRSLDFYRHIKAWLATQPNVTLVRDEVIGRMGIKDDGMKIDTPSQSPSTQVITRHHLYEGRLVFNSIAQPTPPTNQNDITLLQHFCGWFVHCRAPAFDPARATLMDFRVQQANDTRFVYVMPFDAHRALVEFTVFSPALLPQAEYDVALRGYLRHQCGLADKAYAIEEREFGVIPMSNRQFARHPAPYVLNIGTAGGRTKPSTGYTFQRIQRDSRQIAHWLATHPLPTHGDPAAALAATLRDPPRSQWMDRVLLDVLYHQRPPGHRVFSDLFQRNPASLIFKFLDENTTLPEDLRIMSSVNLLPFLRAAVGK